MSATETDKVREKNEKKTKQFFVVRNGTRRVSPKKNANCYQREQNVINGLDNSHRMRTNKKKKEKNLRHYNPLKPWKAVHC